MAGSLNLRDVFFGRARDKDLARAATVLDLSLELGKSILLVQRSKMFVEDGIRDAKYIRLDFSQRINA